MNKIFYYDGKGDFYRLTPKSKAQKKTQKHRKRPVPVTL